jgi:hypothetical protein
MGRAMARRDALIEGIVAENSGVLVRPRGEGDSRFAVFRYISNWAKVFLNTLAMNSPICFMVRRLTWFFSKPLPAKQIVNPTMFVNKPATFFGFTLKQLPFE